MFNIYLLYDQLYLWTLLVGLFMAAEVVTHWASKVSANLMQIDVDATACGTVENLCKYRNKRETEMKSTAVYCIHLHHVGETWEGGYKG